MLPINIYPYMNLEDLNLDYILKKLMKLETDVQDFVEMNAIKYADPIQWNITTQYEKNTIVIDPATGSAYLSVRPVPAGIDISRTEYWTEVFNLSGLIQNAVRNLTEHDAGISTVATFASAPGEWIMWKDILYVATSQITPGDAYTVGANIVRLTVEGAIKDIAALIGQNAQAIATEAEARAQAIADEAEARSQGDETLRADIEEIEETLSSIDIDATENLKLTFLGRYIRNDAYLSAQGMVATSINDIYVANVIYSTGETIMQHYDFYGNLLSERVVGNLNHANDMTFDGAHLIVAGGNSIFKINPSTLALEETVAPEVFCANIAYASGRFYTYVHSSNEIVEMDENFVTLRRFIFPNFYGSLNADFMQGAEVHNGTFYLIINEPNRALAVDINTGEPANTLYFDPFMDDYYPIGEMQSLSFIDGDTFVVNGKARAYDPYESGYHDYGEGQCGFGVGNLKNNVSQNRRYVHGALDVMGGNVNVNANIMVWRPIGTTASPFNTLAEMAAVLVGQYYRPHLILLNSDFDEDLILVDISNVYIYQPTARRVNNAYFVGVNAFVRGLTVAGSIKGRNSNLKFNAVATDANTAETYLFEACTVGGTAQFIKDGLYTLSSASQVTNLATNETKILANVSAPNESEYQIGKVIELAEAYTQFKWITLALRASSGRIVASQTIPASLLTSASYVYLFGAANLAGSETYVLLLEATDATHVKAYAAQGMATFAIDIRATNRLW